MKFEAGSIPDSAFGSTHTCLLDVYGSIAFRLCLASRAWAFPPRVASLLAWRQHCLWLGSRNGHLFFDIGKMSPSPQPNCIRHGIAQLDGTCECVGGREDGNHSLLHHLMPEPLTQLLASKFHPLYEPWDEFFPNPRK